MVSQCSYKLTTPYSKPARRAYPKFSIAFNSHTKAPFLLQWKDKHVYNVHTNIHTTTRILENTFSKQACTHNQSSASFGYAACLKTANFHSTDHMFGGIC